MPSVTGASVASVAQSYKGIRYVLGGYLPQTGWDCSGAMNFWLGHLMGMALPGGWHWTGHAHGPVAAEYLAWGNAYNVTAPATGDLCCWETHVGVYVGAGRMFSAFSHDRGTLETPVSWGPTGEALTYRRIKATSGTTVTGVDVATAAPTGSGCVTQTLMLPALIPYALLRNAFRGRP